MAKATKAKSEDLSSLDEAGIQDRLAENQMQLKRMQFSHAVNPIENPLTIRAVRRTIARLKTEQRKRAIGI